MRKTIAFCAALAVCLALAGCNQAGESGQSHPAGDEQNPVVATVAGEPVTAEEYQGYAYDYLSQAALEFSTQYNADANQADFWRTEYGGQTPLEWVKERADADMARNKGLQVLARELGLYDEISWQDQNKNFESENKWRQQKVAAGEVIYGPKQFTRSQFSSYWQSQVDQLVEDHVKYEILDPTEQELKAYYEQHKEELSRLNFTAGLELVCWSKAVGGDEVVEAALQWAEEGAAAQEIARKLDGELNLQAEAATASIDTHSIPKEDFDYQAMVNLVWPVEAGEWTEPFLISDTQGLVFVKEKTWETIGTFEEAKEEIEYLWRTQETERYIGEKLAQMKVERLPGWDALTIEQLRATA